MKTVNLVHWNAAEAAKRAAQLRAAGYAVTTGAFDGAGLRALRADPPAAFVIDLSRLPSHGRSVAFVLRQTRATRHVPLVFVDGAPEKVAAVRALFPDAVFTAWTRIRADLKRALAAPPADAGVDADQRSGAENHMLADLGGGGDARAWVNRGGEREAALPELLRQADARAALADRDDGALDAFGPQRPRHLQATQDRCDGDGVGCVPDAPDSPEGLRTGQKPVLHPTG